MRVAWASDIHLNFPEADTRQMFYTKLAQWSDAVAVSGDIAESPSVEQYLLEMAEHVQRPIFFVLGNHDFYRGSITATRRQIASLAAREPLHTYLTATDVVELTSATAIVGHDGWADARLGNSDQWQVIINDYLLIEELSQWRHGDGRPESLCPVLNELGDEAARHLQNVLTEAARSYHHRLVVTHVPPFREAAWYKRRPCDDDWLPHMACKAAGEVLLDIARAHPSCNLTVFRGHTHGGGHVAIRDNLQVFTAEADYGRPEIQRIFEVE